MRPFEIRSLYETLFLRTFSAFLFLVVQPNWRFTLTDTNFSVPLVLFRPPIYVRYPSNSWLFPSVDIGSSLPAIIDAFRSCLLFSLYHTS